MAENNIYEDGQIEISNDSILLKNHYFPLLGSKRVPFGEIEFVTLKKPSLLKGKFRIWGIVKFVTVH